MSGVAKGALDGFRILDLTSVVMGPFATQVLADYGAEVIKIEPPDGDTTRNIGPSRERGLSAGFIGMNRGKQSLAVDLKQPAGAQLVLRLAQSADALVCNLRPQAMRRLGLHYEALATANPRLVYLSLVGYGRHGRYAGKPAYDDLIQAAIGLPRLVQRADGGEPRYVPLAMCDRTVGIAAVNALLAALLHRERSGKGQEVEVPMFELMSMLLLSDHLGGAAFDPPQGPMGYARLLSKQRRPYATQDGYIAVLPYNDQHWRRFFALAGRPDLPDGDERFADIAQRTRNIDALHAGDHALAQHQRAHAGLMRQFHAPLEGHAQLLQCAIQRWRESRQRLILTIDTIHRFAEQRRADGRIVLVAKGLDRAFAGEGPRQLGVGAVHGSDRLQPAQMKFAIGALAALDQQCECGDRDDGQKPCKGAAPSRRLASGGIARGVGCFEGGCGHSARPQTRSCRTAETGFRSEDSLRILLPRPLIPRLLRIALMPLLRLLVCLDVGGLLATGFEGRPRLEPAPCAHECGWRSKICDWRTRFTRARRKRRMVRASFGSSAGPVRGSAVADRRHRHRRSRFR